MSIERYMFTIAFMFGVIWARGFTFVPAAWNASICACHLVRSFQSGPSSMVTGLDVVTTTLVVPPVMVGPPWKPTGEPPNKDVGTGNAPCGDVADDVDMVKKFSTKKVYN